jgi:proline iminopeptidase
LAQGRRLVLYDPRDRGRSDEVVDPALISMQNEVRDLEALRRHLGTARMNLIGWSYLGAMVALYAAEHPDRVATVVQVGPLPPRKVPHWEAFVRNRAARSDRVSESQVAEMRRAGVHERDPLAFCRAQWRSAVMPSLADAASVDAAVPPDVCDSPNERLDRIKFAPLIDGLGDWDWRGKLGSVRARVLVVHGARDNIPLESSREWVRAFGNARLLVVDAAGHHPFAEQPAVFARAVDAFLRGGWPEGAVPVR